MSSDDQGGGPPDPFAQPSPLAFDYRPLLEALRECRIRANEVIGATGPRSPLHLEGGALVYQIDSVARLTRVPGALTFVRRTPGPRARN